ncbi:hypothetical protein BHE74_00032293 [Ensete ventricosum]|nr:hypothetical protein BHE74_00032293 [Ensete ventricosum]RZS05317.1 hypothetical protein BHM03_00035804 [Ensete ventricosum]
MVTKVPLLVKDDATAVKHEEDCLVQDATLMSAMVGSCMKKTTTMSIAQVVFCKTLVDGVVGVEVEDAVVALLAVRCDLAEPISAKQRKKEMKQSNGNSVSMYAIGIDDCRLVTAGANVVGALAEPETGEVAGVGNRSPAK